MAYEGKSEFQVHEETEWEANGRTDGTANDAREMDRLGKKQQLNVRSIILTCRLQKTIVRHWTNVRSAIFVFSPSSGSPVPQ